MAESDKKVGAHSRNEIVKLIQRKQKEREEDFGKLRMEHKALGTDAQNILQLTWDDLKQKLQSRQLTATKVLEAYIGKALKASEHCNPVTEFISQAHEWANELDGLAQVKGPLHGIPFCVKDDTDIIGMDTSLGFGKRLFQPAAESAVIVKVLLDLGAIPFAKTNVPQGISSMGCYNPVFGRTTNARNSKLTPGGSSGGSAALVGFGGSLFGTGTDLGGSGRIPGHFNGVVGFKPTAGRISSKGFVGPITPCVVGIEEVMTLFAQNVTILNFVFEAMIKSGKNQIYDAMTPAIPWDSATFSSTNKLRIGYCTSIPYFPPMGDSGEVLTNAKETLESLGHILVPFSLPDGADIMLCFIKLFQADMRNTSKNWKNEETTDDSKLAMAALHIPRWVHRMIGGIMRTKVGPPIHSKRLALLAGNGATKSTDICDAVAMIQKFQTDILSKWEALNLDALVTNVLPFPATRPSYIGKLLPAIAYTVIWNMVECPAGVLPFGVESGSKVDEYKDEGDLLFKLAKKAM